MAISIRFLISIVLVSLTLSLKAQVNRYMVFFSDKANSPYSIEKPEDFLSEKAISRRQKQAIDIQVNDLPVNPQYLKQLVDRNIDVYFSSKWFNAALVQDSSSAIERISDLPFVKKTELIARNSRLSRIRNEPVVSEVFDITTQDRSNLFQNSLLGIDKMHQRGFRGEGITIAVFDAGFRGVNEFDAFQHLHENNQIKSTYDFVTNDFDTYKLSGHGTNVLSCIAAFSPDSMIGTAYESDIILCITEDVPTEYRIEEYNWLLAAEYADSAGVDIINSSLGYSFDYSDPAMDYATSDMNGNHAVITRAADIAASKGILVVTSAGNEGDVAWNIVAAPADGDSVLSVGSIRDDSTQSGFSSNGPTSDGRIKPEVVALGSRATVIHASGRISTNSGTSFAAPQVAGLAAGLWQAIPDLTNMELIQTIKSSGTLVNEPNNSLGSGIPNFIIASGGSVLSVNDVLNSEISVFPNPVEDDKVFVRLDGLENLNTSLNIELLNIKGQPLESRNIDNIYHGQVVEVDIPMNQPGTYLIRITSKLFNKTVKILKY